ncbi:MAG: tryptophan synthase subunit alpha [Verrucomicrobia bacterium]|nr:tryptophan synthase subunit alpha [Verrucomicrobiota bacterium]
MSILAQRFAELRAEKCCGFISFIVAGDPNLSTTADLLAGLSELRPVAIELGIPFSDPTADGPVIQRAAQRALRSRTTLPKVLALLHRMRRRELAPIVLFSYFNPLLQYGLARLAREASRCNVAGVLAVDLPADASAPLRRELCRTGIDLIQLVAPTTSDARLAQITKSASGFIYVVSRTGVTGTARELEDESRQIVARVRAVTELPVAVGFGITSAEQARRVCQYADAAVVGSRLVAEIEKISAAVRPKRCSAAAVVRLARNFAVTDGAKLP